MDTVLQALFSWQFIIFCLAVAALTTIFRRIIEYLLINNKKFKKSSKLWRDVILPIAPIFIGVLFAIVAFGFPYPVILTISGRFAWGLTGGLLSGWVYRIINAFIGNFVKTKNENADISDPNELTIDKK